MYDRETRRLVIVERGPGLPSRGEWVSTKEVMSPAGPTITVIRS